MSTEQIAAAIEAQFRSVAAQPQVTRALDFIRKDAANTLSEQIALAAIASPPFQEQARAQEFRDRLIAYGCRDVRIDAEGNVIALRPGAGSGPKLVVSAHLDSVFPAGTDIAPKERDGKIYAPGIGDDARGLAEVLALVRALNAAELRTVGDLCFVGTVGEEGLGDLRGVRALLRDHAGIDGFISIDGIDPARITHTAVGSHRYRIRFRGPGGHSYGAFGRPSALHAMGRAIATIADLHPQVEPKTTFNVGVAAGGSSVNAIAAEAALELDLRSVEMPALLELEAAALAAVHAAAQAENARWNSTAISVDIESIGARPAGAQPVHSAIVQTALLAVRAVGLEPSLKPSSTDANIPISCGIPALTLGCGGAGGNTHALDEWFDPKDAHLGPSKNLLAVLGLAGVQGVSTPTLAQADTKQ